MVQDHCEAAIRVDLCVSGLSSMTQGARNVVSLNPFNLLLIRGITKLIRGSYRRNDVHHYCMIFGGKREVNDHNSKIWSPPLLMEMSLSDKRPFSWHANV